MNEPRGLEIADWFSAIFAGLLTAVLGGLGTFALFFRRSKDVIYKRIDDVEHAQRDLRDNHLAHREQLLGLESNARLAAERFADLKQLQRDKAEELKTTIELLTNNINKQMNDLMRELRTKT